MGMNNGMPLNFFNDEKQVEQVRQARAMQQQAMQQAELDQMNSQSVNNMANAQATATA
jgi:hypothetical protein